ncbi:MAG TPA: adenylyl-sulfate kinase [Polyangiaceae bacterium]
MTKLRVFTSDDSSGRANAVAARLREASSEFSVLELAGASTLELVERLTEADVAVVVVDAASGPNERALQDLRLAALLGVEHAVVAVDGLEGLAEPEAVFGRIEVEARACAEDLELALVPISVNAGHNLVRAGGIDWYRGPTVARWLESIELAEPGTKPFRMPVETVTAGDDGRGAAGTIASGEIRKGAGIRVQGHVSRVQRIVAGNREVERAAAPESVVLFLEGAFEIGVGDLVSSAEHPAEVADQFEATIVWLDPTPLLRGRDYVFAIGGKAVTATIGSLKRKEILGSPTHGAPQKFEQNEVGVCNLRLDRPIAFDPYRENRRTGGFLLLDPNSRAAVGLGMLHFALRRAQNVHWQAVDVNKSARSALNGQKPCVLWYTGLSGAGKSTIANLVDKKLHAMRRHTYLLDGDNVRHGLNKDLGFTAADRVENIRRIAEVAKLMVDAGLIVGTAFISPFRAEREMARALLGEGEFIEIFVDTPLGVAEQRDPKGLYKKARRGELKNFTGIDSPYEAPENPDLAIDTTKTSPEVAADIVIGYLEARGIIVGD